MNKPKRSHLPLRERGQWFWEAGTPRNAEQTHLLPAEVWQRLTGYVDWDSKLLRKYYRTERHALAALAWTKRERPPLGKRLIASMTQLLADLKSKRQP